MRCWAEFEACELARRLGQLNQALDEALAHCRAYPLDCVIGSVVIGAVAFIVCTDGAGGYVLAAL